MYTNRCVKPFVFASSTRVHDGCQRKDQRYPNVRTRHSHAIGEPKQEFCQPTIHVNGFARSLAFCTMPALDRLFRNCRVTMCWAVMRKAKCLPAWSNPGQRRYLTEGPVPLGLAGNGDEVDLGIAVGKMTRTRAHR